MNGGKRKIELIEYVGLFLVAFSFLMLVVNPGGIGNSPKFHYMNFTRLYIIIIYCTLLCPFRTINDGSIFIQ